MKMTNTILLIILFLLLIVLAKSVYDITYEHFDNAMVDKSELMDNVYRLSRKTTVNIAGKELDDKLITSFIKNDAESGSPSLDYPEETPSEVTESSSLDEIEKVKLDYENLIETKTQKQNIKLSNLLYELQKINKLESKLECK